ncbi:hypothetical protein Tco_1376312 [Tanacetum coccineum]
MSFEEAVGRLTAFEERIKSQDTLEANDQDKLVLASSNNQSHGKGRASKASYSAEFMSASLVSTPLVDRTEVSEAVLTNEHLFNEDFIG